MRRVVVILCDKVFWKLPWGGGGRTWKYYNEILNISISPSENMCKPPKWCKPWMWKLEHSIANTLFQFLKRNKEILQSEYYRRNVTS